MAGKLNLTSPDDMPEPYILTNEEETEVINNAIASAKEYYQYRHLEKGDSLDKIEEKMKSMDWFQFFNKAELLYTANSNKNYRIWEVSNRQKEKEQEILKAKELKERYTANFVFGLMSFVSKNSYGKELIVNNDTKYLIKVLCFFISNDSRFEAELGFSFNKGLLIRGAAGLGKTHLVKCIKDNEIKPVEIISTIDISEAIKDEGVYNPCYRHTLYLDDVGTEEAIVNHFGTKINWVKNFIEIYYLRNKPFNRLIISTNNNFDEIESKYGFRVRSRIKDMFNIIDITGKDLRG